MRKIISISGELQVGKDTFALPLIAAGFVKASFAGNLKNMCGEIFGLSDYQLNDPVGKASQLDRARVLDSEAFHQIVDWIQLTHDISSFATMLIELKRKYVTDYVTLHGTNKTFSTPREVLQFVGTDLIRELNPQYHVEVLLHTLKSNPDTRFCVTDSRFSNERKVLKDEFNATLVRVKRPFYTPEHLINAEIPAPDSKSTHISENSLGPDSEYDAVVLNDGSIEDLHDIAKKFII